MRMPSGSQTGSKLALFGEGRRHAEPENAAEVQPVIAFSEGSSSASVTWVSIDGRHRRLSSSRSARCYYVLSGNLTFVVGSEAPIPMSTGDALVIPRGLSYDFSGTATYLVINTPAFESADDVFVEQLPTAGNEEVTARKPHH